MTRWRPKDRIEPPQWTADIVARLATAAVQTVLEREGMDPLRARRSRKAEREWTIALTVACLGWCGLTMIKGTTDHYSIPAKVIRLSSETVMNRRRDLAFTIAHELGHWFWFEVLHFSRDTRSPKPAGYDVCEWFANVFASALLGRMPYDVELDDSLGAHAEAIASVRTRARPEEGRAA